MTRDFGVRPHPAHDLTHEKLGADDESIHPVPHAALRREDEGGLSGRRGDRGFGNGWWGLGIFCGQPRELLAQRGADGIRLLDRERQGRNQNLVVLPSVAS